MARGLSLKELKMELLKLKTANVTRTIPFLTREWELPLVNPRKMNVVHQKGQSEILSDVFSDMFTALEASPSPPQTKALKCLILCSCGRNVLYQRQTLIPQAKDK